MLAGKQLGFKSLLLHSHSFGRQYGKNWRIQSAIVRLTSSGPPPSIPPKYGSFSHKYDRFISRWPKVYAIHSMVIDGSRWCFSDIKTYIRVKRELYMKKRNLPDLSMSELEVLVQSGSEMLKMVSLIVILQIPGPGDLLILLLIFFPRLVLTRHFWSDNQRKKFFLYDVTKSMTKGTVLRRIIGNPSSVNCIHLPKIEELPTSLVHVLSSIHSFYYLPGISRRLSKRCEAMRELDKRLYAEIDCLTSRQLYFHMYIRRIDYTKQSEQEMRDILRKWLKFTSNLENSAYLCAPVFFNGRKS